MQRALRSNPLRLLACLGAGALALAITSCSTTGVAVPSSATSSLGHTSEQPNIRQTDDAGRSLPFENQFPNRWSINNDGTTYEPCTAVEPNTASQFGLIPDSVRDVAASDFQTARGCKWKFRDDGRSSLSQAVGNLMQPENGLTGYKQQYAATVEWRPDIEIQGRRAIVGSTMPSECTVFVESGAAIVGTGITRFGAEKPPLDDICESAISFLRITIGNIPE
ncbi:DUF3558 family protein [Gordonia amicalis]|uniref:DUF3558 family protein n=1 Tax=Gordonia amicalis TaxID=89053 RepID=UPI0037BE7C66